MIYLVFMSTLKNLDVNVEDVEDEEKEHSRLMKDLKTSQYIICPTLMMMGTVSVKNIETKSQKNWDKKSKKFETYKKNFDINNFWHNY